MIKDLNQQLENPEIFRINRLDAHSDHVFYESEETYKKEEKTLYMSLNGEWKYRWSKNLAERCADFYEENYDVSKFDTIMVPSHVEMNGYDKLHYVNTMYPWDGKANLRPPYIDKEYNPVSSYVKEFDLPKAFEGKKVCISLDGVEQAFSLWINGTYVGYAEDTFTPSHFDLTPYVRKENNRLCVEVYKRSSAAWLEDQDFFRFSGIFRSVTLYAKPKVHIEDLWVIPVVEESLNSATLTIKMKVSGVEEGAVPNIHAKLRNSKGKKEFNTKLEFTKESLPVVEVAENKHEYFCSQTFMLDKVKLWDIHKPKLYQIELKVYGECEELIEIVPQILGFRRFEIKDQVMFLNGKRLIINGVNRHEWNPSKGRAIQEDDMVKDLEVFRENNITAVRTSHYPNQSRWYELCDSEGIIVMDETNLETHGSWQKMGALEPSWNIPASKTEWRNVVIDRAVSMFERDKNHPSILWWSCGNESYAGECIMAMGEYFRRKDPSRIVHYEGSFWNRGYDDISDVESRMYAFPHEIEEYFREDGRKPFVLCEYMHDMGNSLGGMESYIQLLEKYPAYQGGFIWDYMDQALYKEQNGKKVLGYGGDFGDRPTDYNFSGNGIVFADRKEKPAMQEVRYWYLSPEDRKNHDDLNEELMNKNSVLLSEEVKITKKPFEVVYGDVNLGVKGEGFHLLFSYLTGGPVSMVYGNREWSYRAARPTYHRAHTENDMANGFPQKSGLWKVAELYQTVKSYQVNEKEEQVEIVFEFDTALGNISTVNYTVYCDGTMVVESNLRGSKTLPPMGRYGMNFIIPDEIVDFEYLGYSGETYPDRYKGGIFGKHKGISSIPEYLVPQECGCHVYNNYVKLNSGEGQYLKFTALDERFHFSVLPNTAHELEQAQHKYELPNTGRTDVNILKVMRGVGGIDTWGADVEEEYHISAEEDITLRFMVQGGVESRE